MDCFVSNCTNSVVAHSVEIPKCCCRHNCTSIFSDSASSTGLAYEVFQRWPPVTPSISARSSFHTISWITSPVSSPIFRCLIARRQFDGPAKQTVRRCCFAAGQLWVSQGATGRGERYNWFSFVADFYCCLILSARMNDVWHAGLLQIATSRRCEMDNGYFLLLTLYFPSQPHTYSFNS